MPETMWHMFVDCELAKESWVAIGLWGKIDRITYEVEDHISLFLKLLCELDKDEVHLAITVTWAL